MQSKSKISSQYCPSSLIFVTDNSTLFSLVCGGKDKRLCPEFPSLPRVPLGCGSDTYVNAMGISLADYKKRWSSGSAPLPICVLV